MSIMSMEEMKKSSRIVVMHVLLYLLLFINSKNVIHPNSAIAAMQ